MSERNVEEKTDEIVEYFECKCYSQEHLLRFEYYIDDLENRQEDGIHVSVLLSAPGFWNRLWSAIRFVFGYECRYGHWDGIHLRKQDGERLRTMIDHWLNSGIPKFSSKGE